MLSSAAFAGMWWGGGGAAALKDLKWDSHSPLPRADQLPRSSMNQQWSQLLVEEDVYKAQVKSAQH